jgi:CHRD domain
MSVSRRSLLALVPVAWAGSLTAAMAASMTFSVPLTGAQQVPPVTTSGSGTAELTYDAGTRKLTWSVSYSGLSSAATMAHIHAPAAEGKNAGVEIWLSKKGVTPSSPISGAATLTEAQAKQLMAGEMYINVHTKDHPTGEIRGQIVPPKS